MQDNKSLKQIMDFRKEKLNILKESNINPFPENYKPTHFSASIKENYENFEGKKVKIAGRIMSLRKMGKASFSQIMDEKRKIQFFIRRDDVGDSLYKIFKLVDIGDFIGVEGLVFTTKTGEISIRAENITILSKSIRPLPIVKEKDGMVYDAFSDKEQRYRNRHLDLILNPKVKETFFQRATIIKNIRKFLDEKDFLEVETPVLQPIYGGANARPFITHHNALDQTLYLRIADELYLKRLIIGGINKVYEISKDFRNEGIDRNHNPEFTMLEFYCAYADYEDCMNLVEDMIRETAERINALKVKWGDLDIDLSLKFERKSFHQLIESATGSNINEMDDKKLREICREKGITVRDDAKFGQMLDEFMSQVIEPDLIQPTFVVDYPKIISPLAKEHRNGNTNLVERFELFIGGTEFANSFTELNDPIDQRQRLEEQAKLRDLGDQEAQPIDEDFIQAMECGMPPTGGVCIGIDRLTMLLTGNRWIKDVILFPTLRSEPT